MNVVPILKAEIESNMNQCYEIEIYGVSFIDIHISNIKKKCKNKNNNSNKKFPPKKCKNKLYFLENLKKLESVKSDKYFQELKDISELIKSLKNINKDLEMKKKNIKLIENHNKLELIIVLSDPFSSSIKIKFELLNVIYYLITGPRYKKIYKYKNPIYTSLEDEEFNFDIIKKNILEKNKENIDDIDDIDYILYFDEEKKGFIKIRQNLIQTPLSLLILEIHYNPQSINKSSSIDKKLNVLKNKVRAFKKKEKDLINEKYDLIYLYASPIMSNETSEEFTPIENREEIKIITNLMIKSKKKFNCIFESSNEKTLTYYLEKETKILHISSHGSLDENLEYSLILEEKGIKQSINYEKLKKILEKYKSKIKNIDLVFISTCNSQALGELFLKYGAKNVIYIHKMTEISNTASVQFTKYFYEELTKEKGINIKEAFFLAQSKLKKDKELLYLNPYHSCKDHKHNINCKHRKKEYTEKIYGKICDCQFEEFNIHKINCEFYKKIFEEKKENLLNYKMYDKDKDIIKICCCDYENSLENLKENIKKDINYNDINNKEPNEIPHSEYLKLILKSQNSKSEEIIIFKNNKKGELKKNKNCVFDFDENKYFSIIGRRKDMKKIFDIITDNSNSVINHFIIISGPKQSGKQDFAESLCVYLFERKIIINYNKNIYEIKSKSDIDYIEKKILYYNQNVQGKIIIIIKISYSLEKQISLNLLKDIINEKNIINNNFYFLILINKDEKIQEEKFKNIHLMKLNQESANNLLYKLCISLRGKSYYELIIKKEENKLYELLEKVDYDRKKIKEIAELISEGKNINIIEDIFNFKLNKELIEYVKFQSLMGNDNISQIYFILANMPDGLPNALLNLICPNYHVSHKQSNDNRENINFNILIGKDSKEGWYYTIENYNKNILLFYNDKANQKKKCISNCLEVFAKLFFLYIKKNKDKIYYLDNNIHYLFNSYNGIGIWKTFNESIYESCFSFIKNKDEDEEENYNNILQFYFDLDKYTNNILNLIEYNSNFIKENLLENNDNIKINKEYLEQILLMLPSSYFLENDCKKVINRCKDLCQKLGLKRDEKRLLLFLYSLEHIPNIKMEETNNEFEKFKCITNELMAEFYFLKGLKDKDIDSLLSSIDYYKKILIKKEDYFKSFDKNKDIKKEEDNYNKENNLINEYRISYVHYEIGALYYTKNDYDNAKDCLNDAKSILKENDILKDRINIDLSLLEYKIIQENLKNQSQLEKEYSNIYKLLNETINRNLKEKNNLKKKVKESLKQEAYDLKLKILKNLDPDIYILNSNPLINNLSVLDSGIYAYNNNQYYLIQKLYEKIKLNIMVKSIVLNKNNLVEALNKEGKILIIQSDDFSEKGEIILESNIGESQILSNEYLVSSILPEKIKYKVVILCFIKSSKLIDKFKGRSDYLITFENINCYDLDSESLLRYNELSIEFLINFIEGVTKQNLLKAFNNSKKLFIEELKKCEKFKDQIQNNEFIRIIPEAKEIAIFENNIDLNKNKNKNKEKLILFYPLPNIPDILRSRKYWYEIYKYIKQIIIEKSNCINILIKKEKNKNFRNEKEKQKNILKEIIKFFYRHQTFNELCYVHDYKKYGNSLKDIINKFHTNEKKTPNGETFYLTKTEKYDRIQSKKKFFFFIDNYKEIESDESDDNQEQLLKKYDNLQFFIIHKAENEKNNIKENINNNQEFQFDIENLFKNFNSQNNINFEIDNDGFKDFNGIFNENYSDKSSSYYESDDD